MSTLLAQMDHYLDPETGSVVPPILNSTTFARDENYELIQSGVSYARYKNITGYPAEKLLAKLEGGEEAFLFGSGLAAATTLIQSLKQTDHVLIPELMYHGLRDWMKRFSADWGIEIDQYDGTRLETLENQLQPGRTRIVWVETPANPTWDITDINEVSKMAHKVGAYVVCDSTVSTPILSQPFEYGADFVMHSATKYLNGHSDVLAGALICKNKNDLWESIRFQRKQGGAVLGPFEAWLLIRGMRTLHVRMDRACANATEIIRRLKDHPKIEQILYPGLKAHPGHEIAKRQMPGGFGAVFSLLIKGDAISARRFTASTKLFIPATSLGGVESLVEHRASVEGPDSPVAPNLVRFSVGIEDANDLFNDLDRALHTI